MNSDSAFVAKSEDDIRPVGEDSETMDKLEGSSTIKSRKLSAVDACLISMSLVIYLIDKLTGELHFTFHIFN